jgi:hypothetical protein
MRNLGRSCVFIALVALAWPASAKAGTISLDTDFQGTGTGYFFTDIVYPNNYPDVELRGKPIPLAGILGSVKMSQGTADLGPTIAGNTFEAYCVDLLAPIFEQGLPLPPDVYGAEAALMADWTEPGGLIDQQAGRRAAWLYTEYANEFADDDPADAEFERAALQMAIWNELYDGDQSVATGAGKFYVNANNAAVMGYANDYLLALTGAINSGVVSTTDAVWLKLSFTKADGTVLDAQDFIGPLDSPQPVPEPSAALLLGMGVLSLAAFRSRKMLLRRA